MVVAKVANSAIAIWQSGNVNVANKIKKMQATLGASMHTSSYFLYLLYNTAGLANTSHTSSDHPAGNIISLLWQALYIHVLYLFILIILVNVLPVMYIIKNTWHKHQRHTHAHTHVMCNNEKKKEDT